ncbi:MAG: transketolase C-terminal domain-containing protein [bacterium]|nr:transketolase C-terminal domain-containing protein [bacterium]
MLKKSLNSNLFNNPEFVPTRDGYGEGLVEAGKKDKNVVVLCCDLTESTRSLAFAKKFPDRFVQVGVAEQNMAGLAAGMANYGKIPFVASYAVFSPGRNWAQIRVAIAYGNQNVKIVGAHAGISVGPDGATHQALEDIAIMRVLPNMTVVVPCDVHEARKATLAAAQTKGPVYIRLAREKTPVITTPRTPFEIGKAYVVREGKDATIVACGPLLYEALLAAECLAGNREAINTLNARYPKIALRVGKSQLHGHSREWADAVILWSPSKIEKLLQKAGRLDVEIINCPTVKPLDAVTIVESAKKTGFVVTVEEHQVHGGLYGAVTEILSLIHPTKVLPIGMPDSFGESGEPMELLEKYRMTAPWIINRFIQ